MTSNEVNAGARNIRRRPLVWSIRSVVAMGLLSSLSVVLGTALAFNLIPFGATYTMKVSISLLPVQLAGLCYGPMAGFVVGVVSDFLKWAIAPTGYYHPGIGIDMGLTGFIVALSLMIIQRRPIRMTHEPDATWLNKLTFAQVLPGIALSQIVCSMLLNSYWIASMQHVSIWVTMSVRVINSIGMIPVYAVLLRACGRSAQRFGLA